MKPLPVCKKKKESFPLPQAEGTRIKAHADLQAPSVSQVPLTSKSKLAASPFSPPPYPKLPPACRFPSPSSSPSYSLVSLTHLLFPLRLSCYLAIYYRHSSLLLSHVSSPGHAPSATFSLCSGLFQTFLAVLSLIYNKNLNHIKEHSLQQ